MKPNLRIIGKFALLLVIIGFFMPIACDMNGFQLARTRSTFDAILMYLLFFSAVVGCIIGVLLLMKKRVKPVFDWVFLLICIGSGLIVCFDSWIMGNYQQGTYFILAGWIISLVFQIISKTKKET